MHFLKITGILILIIGIILFTIGLLLYWRTNPISGWASFNLTMGTLLLLGAIILLCVSQQYDMRPIDNLSRA